MGRVVKREEEEEEEVAVVVEGYNIVSLQHLGPNAFLCNGAQLANTTRHRRKTTSNSQEEREGRYMEGRGMKMKILA